MQFEAAIMCCTGRGVMLLVHCYLDTCFAWATHTKAQAKSLAQVITEIRKYLLHNVRLCKLQV